MMHIDAVQVLESLRKNAFHSPIAYAGVKALEHPHSDSTAVIIGVLNALLADNARLQQMATDALLNSNRPNGLQPEHAPNIQAKD